ncbi:hypothetical protein M5K25_009945 [Dendrobium thyrsiflorum]|uniref:CCD97-like C-terminal domain-containing protein n=1 Tax=Dendrobium thyrsiflorum TaxID=117978 RepID=A0ABD0V742_DENTH
MERSAMEGIAERLAAMDSLYFPGGIRSPPLDASQRKAALFDLISRDAPIFLERYGGELTANELGVFDVLRSDYEVGWHVDRLRRSLVPTEADSRAKSATVRNRRRAYMERLIRGGEYFSEDSMREREPYLHHEYVGRFQDPVGRVSSRPGRSGRRLSCAGARRRCWLRRLEVSSRGWGWRGRIGLEVTKAGRRKRRRAKMMRSGEERNGMNVVLSSSKYCIRHYSGLL